MSKEDTPSWSERQRLHFIERLLFWRGYINRRDVMEHFGISAPQATNDLVNYTTRNREGCAYNVRTKRYEATKAMGMVLLEPDFGRDMEALGVAVAPHDGVDFVVTPELPVRACPTPIIHALCRAAHRDESIEVKYWSVSSGTAEWRRISPRAFANDGLRWHVRARCHKRGDFRDFNVGRIKQVRRPKPCAYPDCVDEAWVRQVTLLIRPNPKLEANVRQAMEMDYAMKRGVLRYPVREALQVYAARRLGFVEKAPGDAVALPMLNETGQLEWFGIEAV
jgi:hypothetical protein